ncbi:rcc01693 family protein [Shimia biformata]|uniref:rcc01693 family protein n=1 Tax=Shimia biformata TaxID=1294299 RepID=UPI00194E95D0|nr:rcc01693 family protein [Shimia biformata]
MPRFDWGALMAAGIGGLGLRPAEFWALTPAELRLMLGRSAGPPPMSRHRLDDLLKQHPDPERGAKENG